MHSVIYVLDFSTIKFPVRALIILETFNSDLDIGVAGVRFLMRHAINIFSIEYPNLAVIHVV